MNQYNINLIDPFSLSTVGDLYSLYRAGSFNPQFNIRHKKLVDRIYPKRSEESPFLHKYLRDLSVLELKFLAILTLDRLNLKSYFTTSGGKDNSIVYAFDALSAINCFLSEFPKETYSHTSNKEITYFNYKEVIEQVKLFGLGVLNEYNIQELEITHKVFKSGYFRFSKNNDKVTEIERCESGLIVQNSNSTYTFKRPFRDFHTYPKITARISKLRLRDILMSASRNISNGWIRRIPQKIDYFKEVISKEKFSSYQDCETEFLNKLHSSIDSFSRSEVRDWIEILIQHRGDSGLWKCALTNFYNYENSKHEGYEFILNEGVLDKTGTVLVRNKDLSKYQIL